MHVNKIRDIMSNLSDKNIDIAANCETWLADMNNPTTAVIKSFGYKFITVSEKIKRMSKKGPPGETLHYSVRSGRHRVANALFKKLLGCFQ